MTSPRCHRCGKSAATERFVVTNPYPCVAGAQPKATGYLTHGCDDCWAAWADGETNRKAET